MTTDIADTLPQDAVATQQALDLSASEEAPPSNVPGYQVLRRVGAGKFGSVWLARELNTGKQVAIKFYAQRRGVDWTLLSREVEKLAVLYTSRHIVRLLAVGWDHDPPYYVMEYLENGSLAQRLEHGPLPAAEAVRLTTRIAQALVHAHGSGILHCDLKPANVLLDQDLDPRLCDFGQSRLAEERSPALGTLFYMAPEQADLKAVPDARWDVYALGAILYHLLCGEPPYRTAEAEDSLRRAGSLEQRLALYRNVVTTSPRPQAHRRVRGVDASLAEILERCLAVDPERRLANPQAVLDRLQLREQQRARRPLILTGILLPVLLILAVLPFALDALHAAISTSRSNLIARALESDALSVHLLAGSLRRELEDRLTELQTIADDGDVRAAILEHVDKPREQRAALFELLSDRKTAVDRRRKELGRTADASWFFQDARGYQRWRTPVEATDQRFHYRDYFHGQSREYDEATAPADLPPLTRPHVSTAYRSTSERTWRLALSVPVFAPSENDEAPQVIGVLARSLSLNDLLKDHEQSLEEGEGQGSTIGRQLALVDSRSWNLLAHPWMTDEHLKTEQASLARLQLDDEFVEQLREMPTTDAAAVSQPPVVRIADYRDPVAAFAPQPFGGNWLAAFAPVGETGWIAVVQERRDPVEAPVEHLRERLVWSGLGMLAIVIGLVAACWAWIVMLLNDRRPRWWPRGRWGAGMKSLSTSDTATRS